LSTRSIARRASGGRDHDLDRRNLVVLGFFKYSTSASILKLAGAKRRLEGTQLNTFFRVVLPLGISFYTFQALSYTIDVYRGNAEAMANLSISLLRLDVPHLVAGRFSSSRSSPISSKCRLTSDKFARRRRFYDGRGEKGFAGKSVR